jgi:toxin HigB-1
LWFWPIEKAADYLCPNQVKHVIELETLAVNSVSRYYCAVIKTFRCPDTEALSKGNPVKRFSNFAAVARRKLRQLEIAGRLGDLRVPPGNRLEALKGNREGQHSIRINDQFRVCFRWTDFCAEDVEIVDYH